MTKELEKLRDELAENEDAAFEEYADSYARCLEIERTGFKRGWNTAEPLIRADERARTIKLLKSESAKFIEEHIVSVLGLDHIRHILLADWLEERLKEIDKKWRKRND